MPIWIEYSYANTVTGSYIHHARDYGSDSGYGVWFFNFNSDHYVYDNIMDWVRYGVNFEGGGTGVIIAYNYIRNVREGDEPAWLHAGVGLHGAHPYMNLIEGNIMPTFLPDNTMGSNSHNLVFRNWLTRESDIDWTITMGNWASDVEMNSRYHSFVGNILGFSGMSGVYELNSSHTDDAYNTVYRHGNFDYVTETTKWDPAVSDHTIPDSYYLTSKPSFFGSSAWPAIGPGLSPMVGSLPAKDRYDGVSPDILSPSPPSGLTVTQ
jgi:hypothetical protein